MPRVKVQGRESFDVSKGKRLVKAIAGKGVEIGHRCGGQARCTTCRVRFVEGEPETFTEAEYEKLKQVDGLGKFRLSCQITVDRDMTVEPLMLAEDMGWDDTGPEPSETVEPSPERFTPEAEGTEQ